MRPILRGGRIRARLDDDARDDNGRWRRPCKGRVIVAMGFVGGTLVPRVGRPRRHLLLLHGHRLAWGAGKRCAGHRAAKERAERRKRDKDAEQDELATRAHRPLLRALVELFRCPVAGRWST